jgi:hypothetical protein
MVRTDWGMQTRARRRHCWSGPHALGRKLAILLVKRRLLHDSQKLLFIYFSVAVSIGFVNHFLQQLGGDAKARRMLPRASMRMLRDGWNNAARQAARTISGHGMHSSGQPDQRPRTQPRNHMPPTRHMPTLHAHRGADTR